jgi:beta-lactam-binding protein with PASTA domain
MNTTDAAASLAAAEFKPVIGASIASSYPVGTVSGTQPAGQALRGATVVILTSVGPPATSATPPQNTLPPSPGPRVKLPKCRPGGPRPCR